MSRIIIAAPKGPTRERLLGFFSERAEVISLEREAVVADGPLLIDDRTVRLGDTDLIDGVGAAIVLDSGYMWPLPKLEPTLEEWEAARHDLDELLRDDRETESLWYSALAILEDRLPLVVNPSDAFAMEAMKPFAFTVLHEGGVPVAPFVATNDIDEVRRLVERQGGELRCLSMLPDEPARWLDPGALDGRRLDEEPMLFQALRGREEVRVIGVAGEGGAWTDSTVRLLGGPLAELLFLPGSEGLVLADFTPSPDLGGLTEAAAQEVLEALWRLIQSSSEEPR